MKFSTLTLLLVTAFAAITCAAAIGWWKHLDLPRNYGPVLEIIALTLTTHTPLWLPIAFVAYAAGRRKLSVWLVAVFAVAQGIAWFTAGWALEQLRRL